MLTVSMSAKGRGVWSPGDGQSFYVAGEMHPADEGPQLAETVRRAQRGDTVALDGLLTELGAYLGRLCGAIALDEGDDALQETMMVIVRSLGSLRQPAAVRGWARRIAIRESLRVARGRAVRIGAECLPENAAIADHATALDVRQILSTLSPEHRAVLVLRHVEGLSAEETAAALGVAVGTVKSRLSRARLAFRARWVW